LEFASRAFRVVFGILVVVAIVWSQIESDKAEKQKIADEAATLARQTRREARQAELWSKVPPSKVELRNPALTPEKYGGDYLLSASLKDLSGQKLTGFEIAVTASDCVTKEKCEVVGQSTDVFWAEIPSQQVRGIAGKVKLPNAPPLRGKLSPTFVVTRVYGGDRPSFLDDFDIAA
jgi:type II secretory pathway pseudopilin PulG